MGGSIFDWMKNNPRVPARVNLDKDRSLRGKQRVKARKRERREGKKVD